MHPAEVRERAQRQLAWCDEYDALMAKSRGLGIEPEPAPVTPRAS